MRENFRIALSAVAGSRTRSVLTILIIAIGITSIVGIQSAIDNLASEVTGSFGKMGAGTFSIRGSAEAPLTRNQAAEIKESIDALAVSAFSTVLNSAIISFGPERPILL